MKRKTNQSISTGLPNALSIKPEIIVKMLKKYGQEVTLSEAEMILFFMFKLADISINQVFEERITLTE